MRVPIRRILGQSDFRQEGFDSRPPRGSARPQGVNLNRFRHDPAHRKAWVEARVTMLFISHDLEVVRYLCDRVAVLYRGRLVEIGATEEVIRRPQHEYTRSLIAAVPRRRVEHLPLRSPPPNVEEGE